MQWHTYPGGHFGSIDRQLYEVTLVILLEDTQRNYTAPHEIRREFFINAELTIEKFAGWAIYQHPEIKIKGVGRDIECNLILFLEK